jgi:large subunit ribosomal protein L9
MANVDVILREKIKNLGAEADIVPVRPGFARNYLIPKGLAFEATRGNRRHIERLKEQRARREAEEMAVAEKVSTKLKKLRIKLELDTGQGGKAFGSITTMDLAKAMAAEGVEVDRHLIILEKPIKSTGRFEVPVKLHPDLTVDLRVQVIAKGSEDVEGEEGGE